MRRLILLAMAMLLATAAPAAAHTLLLSSDPADGSVLAKAPTQITLRFNKVLSPPAYLIVTGPKGKVAPSVVLQEKSLVATIPSGPDGRWTVAYRVIDPDGTPLTGKIQYVVGEAPRKTAPARDRQGILILLLLAGLGAGVLLGWWVIRPSRSARAS